MNDQQLESYKSLLRELAQASGRLDYLSNQATRYRADQIPAELAREIDQQTARVDRAKQALKQTEAQLAQDGQAYFSDPGTEWRRSSHELTRVGAASAGTSLNPQVVVQALSWMDCLEHRLIHWYRVYLDRLYLDEFFALDFDAPDLPEKLESLERTYKDFLDNFWTIYDGKLSRDLHYLADRFPLDIEPLLPSQFDPTNIRMQFDMTLGREARVVDETQDFFTQLLGDIRRLRQAAGRQDIEGLALAQEAAYSRIASFRFQVDQALRQLSEARASLRRLLPLGTMPPTAASSPCEQQDAGQLRESVAAASGPLAGRRQRLEEEYKDLQARYTTLTNRLRALDTGIGRETDSMNRQILEERRAEKAEKRRTVEQQLVELELQMGI